MNEKSHLNNIKAYFITFTTYGTWLHGDSKTSVNRVFNKFEQVRRPTNLALQKHMKSSQKHSTFIMDASLRQLVLNSIIDTSTEMEWFIYALHVRSNHIHLLVKSTYTPEKTLTKLKSCASKSLNLYFKNLNPIHQARPYWSRHGSTRYVFDHEPIFPVMKYIIDEQGTPMSFYHSENYTKMRDGDYFI